LARFEAERETFIFWIVTADETWVSHFEPETKGNPWNGTILHLPGRKKSRKSPSVGKIMVTVFWDCEGVILVDVITRGEKTNSDAYVMTLTELWKRFKRVRPYKNQTGILLQPVNARPHTSLKTRETFTKFG
jgi:hypothetical protein